MNFKIGDKIYYERNDGYASRPNGVYTIRDIGGWSYRVVGDDNLMFPKHMRPYNGVKPKQYIMKHEF